MNQQQVYEQISGTTLQHSAEEPPAAAANEGLLAQVHAIGNVARDAASNCLKGKAAVQEIRNRKNTHGQ